MGVGLHLVVDGLSWLRILSMDTEHFILRCAEGIGMTIVYGPVSAEIPEGVQSVAIIAESHIIVKALSNGQLYIDVFSCFSFDTEVPLSLARSLLGLEMYKAQIIAREGLGPGADGTPLATRSTTLRSGSGLTTPPTSLVPEGP